MSKSSHTPEFRAKASQEHLDGIGSCSFLAAKYSIVITTLAEWVAKYRMHGIDAFAAKSGNASYTSDFKAMCAEAVLSGEGSINDIVAKHNISSSDAPRRWIKMYNANRKLTGYCPKREAYMADAGRKTTLEERKKIVQYCIEHNRDYKGTAEKYGVSYGQVYSWVRKYDVQGEEGLADRRGLGKTDGEADEIERLKREDLRLRRQLEGKDMAVESLKKVKEFERM